MHAEKTTFLNERIIHMNVLEILTGTQERPYVSPTVRVVPMTTECSFLQSNLEPIGGGDDPDIDW